MHVYTNCKSGIPYMEHHCQLCVHAERVSMMVELIMQCALLHVWGERYVSLKIRAAFHIQGKTDVYTCCT